MSQVNQELTVYYDTVERFENLEALFHSEDVDLTQILKGFHNCNEKVDQLILNENINGPYLVDLFQMRHHILELRKVIEGMIRTQQFMTKTLAPQCYSKSMEQKHVNFVKSTIQTPQLKGLKDIAGLRGIKKTLKSLILTPRIQPQLFVDRKACNSALLFGPPGTGKTRLVDALAYEANATLYSVSSSNILSPLVGQTEQNIRALFEYIGSSQNFSILFIDEIDGICTKRTSAEQEHCRRLKTELMCQMSRLEDNRNMFLICATNCPWDLDTAFLRRFQQQLYIPLPNSNERLELFKMFLNKTTLENNAACWEEVINTTEGFSGSDISNLVTRTLNIPIIELEDTRIWKLTADGFYEPVTSSEDFNVDLGQIMCCEMNELPHNSVRTRTVQMLDLINVLDNVNPTTPSSDIKKYDLFINRS